MHSATPAEHTYDSLRRQVCPVGQVSEAAAEDIPCSLSNTQLINPGTFARLLLLIAGKNKSVTHSRQSVDCPTGQLTLRDLMSNAVREIYRSESLS